MNETRQIVSRPPLWPALLHLAGRVEDRLEGELGGVGLSLSKLAVLDNLVRAGEPLPLSRLAERILCVKSNITQLVDRLESDGLVKRLNDPKDRRSTLASITREGRRLHEAGTEAVERVEQEFFGRMKPEQLDSLRALCGSSECGK